MRIFLLFSALAFLYTSPTQAEVRTWTDINGETMEAELVRVLRTDAVFLIEGEQKSIPLKYFSVEDRQYLNRIFRGEENLPGTSEDNPDEPEDNLPPYVSPKTPPESLPKRGESRPAKRPDPEERRWTMRSGEFLRGKPLALTIEDLVILQFPDGKTTSLDLRDFSFRDQELIISYFRDPKPEPEETPPVVEFGEGSLKTLPGENGVIPTEVVNAPRIETDQEGNRITDNTPTTNTPISSNSNGNTSNTPPTRTKPSGQASYNRRPRRTNTQAATGGAVADANTQQINPTANSGSSMKWAYMFGGLLVIVLGFVAAKKVVLGEGEYDTNAGEEADEEKAIPPL